MKLNGLIPQCAKDYYALSFFHRFRDDYRSEWFVINQALKTDIGEYAEYFKTRLKWHNLPIFERMEPRPKVDNIIKRSCEYIEQMCFATAADSNYFEFLVELIESIKATENYSNVSIKILDLGLGEAQKHYLFTNFGIKDILQPGWDVSVPYSTPITEQGRTARPFLPKHFPGYRYYFWLDSDTWIQDENYLYDLILDATKFGIGIARDQYGGEKSVNVGVFCIDAESKIFEIWQRHFIEKCAIRYNIFNEQVAIYNTYLESEYEMPRDIRYNFQVYFFWPIVHENDPHTLYTADKNQRAGIVHLNSKQIRKFGYELYASMRNEAYAKEEVINYWGIRQVIQKQQNRPYVTIYLPDQIRVSFRYRTYPWKEKSAISDLLCRDLGYSL